MKATINDVEIAYTDEGSGTPVVFIHGYPLNRSMWQEQVSSLSDQFRCISIDLRSHGESQAFFWLTSVDEYAAEVTGLLDHLGIDQAVICGFSMGGYVAFALYRYYRRRIRGLILADTRAQADSPEGKRSRLQAALTAQDQGSSAIAEALLPRLLSPKSLAENPELTQRVRQMIETTPVAGIVGDLMALHERPDSEDLLPTISVPTLVLVGEQDALTPPADSQLMAERIPGARLATIPGAAHMASMEQPQAWNQAVADFLKTLS